MTREEVALSLFTGKLDLAFASWDRQVEAVEAALSFADLFLYMAKEKS